jgi:predicted dehydrogenase
MARIPGEGANETAPGDHECILLHRRRGTIVGQMLTRRSATTLLGSAMVARAQGSDPNQRTGKPVAIVVAGLVHGHAAGMFRRLQGRDDVRVVGIVEAKQDVAQRYARQFGLEASLFETHLQHALEARKPDAVMAFSDTFDHKQIVELCAANRVPVMVEKPLAVSNEHAQAIAKAAHQSGIHVLVNYETSWYPSVHQLRAMVREQQIGQVTKIVVRDGHQGPKEIGVQPEFLDWLSDPVRNGAGALFDFGCYGANLATWLFDGAQPLAVSAIAQTLKPHIYTKVDDEATIVLSYPKAQVIIQASWNWPYSRKDMDVYGARGYILAPDRQTLQVRVGDKPESRIIVAPLRDEGRDEISSLVAVLRGQTQVSGLSSLANNMVVTKILTAARDSARTGHTVRLAKP